MADERPVIDERDPADAIAQMVDHVLALAETWIWWDRRTYPVDDRVYTPHKAIRRVADHLVDHLAQLECHLAGIPSLPNQWHGSTVTTPADRAPFVREDLDEARSRLTRLSQIWRISLQSVPSDRLDQSYGTAYTPREMAFCAAASSYYADAIGVLVRDPHL